MSDRLLRGTFPDSAIRFAACSSADACSEGMERLGTDPISGSLLSEALTCAALLSVGLKGGERLSVQWKYPGPVGIILADTNERAHVRGFTQRLTLLPEVATPDEAMGGAGTVSVVSSFPDRVGRTGTTPGVFQDLSRDLAHFLSLSFQIESAVAVGLVLAPDDSARALGATGLLLQPLPGCDLMMFNGVRERVEGPEYRDWLRAEPREPEEALARLGLEEPPGYLEEAAPCYSCHCSREKVESVLRLLDRAELQDMLETDGQAEINCHFCARHYLFSRNDLQVLLRESQVGHG